MYNVKKGGDVVYDHAKKRLLRRTRGSNKIKWNLLTIIKNQSQFKNLNSHKSSWEGSMDNYQFDLNHGDPIRE